MKGAVLFTSAYLLGILAALASAWALKRTILRGNTKPLVLELPSYKLPSLRNAVYVMIDRAMIFVRQAGTVILIVSIILWALANYPKADPPAQAVSLQTEAQILQNAGNTEQADQLLSQADHLINQNILANSFAGRIGHAIEPTIKPLGFDWQIGIGILSSFAAREVFVSTLAIVYGVGADAVDENPQGLYSTLQNAKRLDGSPVFTTAACLSILVFYVLAMQCTSTLAIVRRETGTWKWPAFQFVAMTIMAYLASLIVYQGLSALGVV